MGIGLGSLPDLNKVKEELTPLEVNQILRVIQDLFKCREKETRFREKLEERLAKISNDEKMREKQQEQLKEKLAKSQRECGNLTNKIQMLNEENRKGGSSSSSYSSHGHVTGKNTGGVGKDPQYFLELKKKDATIHRLKEMLSKKLFPSTGTGTITFQNDSESTGLFSSNEFNGVYNEKYKADNAFLSLLQSGVGSYYSKQTEQITTYQHFIRNLMSYIEATLTRFKEYVLQDLQKSRVMNGFPESEAICSRALNSLKAIKPVKAAPGLIEGNISKGYDKLSKTVQANFEQFSKLLSIGLTSSSVHATISFIQRELDLPFDENLSLEKTIHLAKEKYSVETRKNIIESVNSSILGGEKSGSASKFDVSRANFFQDDDDDLEALTMRSGTSSYKPRESALYEPDKMEAYFSTNSQKEQKDQETKKELAKWKKILND